MTRMPDTALEDALKVVREGWDELVRLMLVHDSACRETVAHLGELRGQVELLRTEVSRLRSSVEGVGVA